MPYIQPLTFEQLLKSKQSVGELSLNGYLQNILKSINAGLITKEQQGILLANLPSSQG